MLVGALDGAPCRRSGCPFAVPRTTAAHAYCCLLCCCLLCLLYCCLLCCCLLYCCLLFSVAHALPSAGPFVFSPPAASVPERVACLPCSPGGQGDIRCTEVQRHQGWCHRPTSHPPRMGPHAGNRVRACQCCHTRTRMDTRTASQTHTWRCMHTHTLVTATASAAVTAASAFKAQARQSRYFGTFLSARRLRMPHSRALASAGLELTK